MDRLPTMANRTPRNASQTSSNTRLSWVQLGVILILSYVIFANRRRAVFFESILKDELAACKGRSESLELSIEDEKRLHSSVQRDLEELKTKTTREVSEARSYKSRALEADNYQSKLIEANAEVERLKSEVTISTAAQQADKSMLAQTVEDLKKKAEEVESLKERLLAEQRKQESSTGFEEQKTFIPEELKKERNYETWKREILEKKGDRWSNTCNSPKLGKYLNYTEGQTCPDDWPLAQDLMFIEGCPVLPRRKCFAPHASNFKDPPAFPESLWTFPQDEQILWTHHEPKGMEALSSRISGDCASCFDPIREQYRWKAEPDPNARSTWTVNKLVELKKGGIRLGLDIGGGTGTFAAKMATLNVTIVTTAYNWNLPYMETIALRGLVALHVSHSQRLPFFDNTLDLIHAASALKYLPLEELEYMLYDWDRVLRPGGVIWLENFYTPTSEMPRYLMVLERLKYTKLEWKVQKKESPAEHKVVHTTLDGLLEKPKG